MTIELFLFKFLSNYLVFFYFCLVVLYYKVNMKACVFVDAADRLCYYAN